jgi:hypothetical protein
VQQLSRHLMTRCSTMVINNDSPSKTTIQDILDKPGTSAPSPAERRVAGTLIKRMIDGNGGVVQVPTGSHGQVCSELKQHNYSIIHCNTL